MKIENDPSDRVSTHCTLWQYGLWSFQTGGRRLERFVHKNQHTQRKLLNFENWDNGGPQKFSKTSVVKINYFYAPIHLTNE